MRQKLNGGARSITVVLTHAQATELIERAAKRTREGGRYISVSELARQAIELYLATDRLFFAQKHA
jgi:Arc/MetJ-type ribon-helix-helix transcriptional regulator